MKNPCENCLIKSNCTKICEEKKDYRVYLEDRVTITYILSGSSATYSKEVSDYEHFSRLLRISNQEEILIFNRRIKRIYPESERNEYGEI